ncbi:MAG: membrane protein insertase YidC [Desulfarculales bacterium]|jgi:YidC/Oxa1 family membrane protein insertase|nr:membrane protein insertase YidC [Desulfarculales bacterium]
MDNKRLFAAIFLSLAVLVGYQMLSAPVQTPPPPSPPAAAPQPSQGTEQAAPPMNTERGSGLSQENQAREIRVDTPLYTAVFTERGGALRAVILKEYASVVNGPKGYPALDLKGQDPLSLRLNLINYDSNLENKIFSASSAALNVDSSRKEASLSFTYEYGGVQVVRTYTFRADSYAFQHNIQVSNNTGLNLEMTPELTLTHGVIEVSSYTYALVGEAVYLNGSYTEVAHGDMNSGKVESGSVDFVSLNVPYFLGVMVPETQTGAMRSVRSSASETVMQSTLVEPTLLVESGGRAEDNFLIFYGPQNIDLLEPLGYNLAAAVNFGWFDLIAKPMLSAIKIIYEYTANYGLAIIIVTFIVKLLFWPLTRSSYKSMKRMQQIQPQVAKLKEKFGSNKQLLNKEVMSLYKNNRVNPMGGCAPILIQIPVFFAFYKVLGTATELRHAPFMLWINDLSAPDRLRIGFEIPWVGDGLPILTLLMGASMFIQQKMTPTTGDAAQRRLMMIMPVIFTIMFINFPSGLVLYWFTNNLLSILQQVLVLRGKN